MKPRLLQIVVSTIGTEDAANVAQLLEHVLGPTWNVNIGYDGLPCWQRSTPLITDPEDTESKRMWIDGVAAEVDIAAGTYWDPSIQHQPVRGALGYHPQPAKTAGVPVFWNGAERALIGFAVCERLSNMKNGMGVRRQDRVATWIHYVNTEMARTAAELAASEGPGPGLVSLVIKTDGMVVGLSLNTGEHRRWVAREVWVA